MYFDEKCIVITGATSGIGLSLLKALFKAGNCYICAVGRDDKKLNKIQRSFGGRVRTISSDLRQKEAVDTLFDTLTTPTEDWPGRIDIFIANAGIGYYEAFGQEGWDHIHDIYAINVFSPLYALGKLMRLPEGNRQFVIVASALAKAPIAGYALYSSTKGALDSFAAAFLREKHKNISLTVAYPVAIKTAFYKRGAQEMKVPLIRQSILENTKAILKAIREKKTHVYPSPLLRLGMALNHIFPVFQIYQSAEAKRFKRYTQPRD